MVDWLLTPLSGALTHEIAPWAYWHARCMVAGWAVLLPLGVLLARFYKVTPQQDWPRVLDNKFWWHGHRGFQWAGVALVTLGMTLAWQQGELSTASASWHAWGGWTLGVAVWLQIAGSFARGTKGGPTAEQMRGDHYDMTPWRLAFERLHKGLGWLALLASVAVIALGLVAADAPRWMALVLALWWAALAVVFVHLQRRGRCIDTYQAIWGPDARHPGNQRPPVGWGVRRPLG
jgi:Eukaryotic cytochrome b561